MDNAYIKSPEEALKHFQATEEQGLSEQQVTAFRQKYGKNGTQLQAPLSRAHLLTGVDSLARRPSNSDLGAHSGAIQGSAGYNITGFGGCIVRPGAF
jgi:hypothetical protein